MKNEFFKNTVVRATLRAPDINPKTRSLSTYEILFTLRPSWSGIGKYVSALPGGKFEDVDFKRLADPDQIRDPSFIPPVDVLIQAAEEAVFRELYAELGLFAIILLRPELLFVDVSTNKAGYTSYSFASDLEEKPTVPVKPESAGTRWYDQRQIMNGKPQLLSGHLGMARRAINKLDLQKK